MEYGWVEQPPCLCKRHALPLELVPQKLFISLFSHTTNPLTQLHSHTTPLLEGSWGTTHSSLTGMGAKRGVVGQPIPVEQEWELRGGVVWQPIPVKQEWVLKERGLKEIYKQCELDSNQRTSFENNCFQDNRFKPLSHHTKTKKKREYSFISS